MIIRVGLLIYFMEQCPSWEGNRFPAFYGIRELITVQTSARHLSLSWTIYSYLSLNTLMISGKYDYRFLSGNKEYFYVTVNEVSVSIYVVFYASLGEVPRCEIYWSKDLLGIIFSWIYGLDERQKFRCFLKQEWDNVAWLQTWELKFLRENSLTAW